MASTALVACALLARPAAADDAIWLTGAATGDFNTGTNWNTGTVPTDTAFFGASSTSALSISSPTSLGGWTFNADAAAYTFTATQSLSFDGAGIVINGGSATINNNAGSTTIFNNSATAGTAIININAGAAAAFYNTSSAGNASITNNVGGTLYFFNSSTAGSATITNSGELYFYQFSTAGNAQLINNAGGLIDFSASAGPGIDNKVSAGSISGAGNLYLGANELTVGSNNLSTTYSGVILDGGFNGGSFASLVKTGTGTLTLSGTNTYSGGTTFAGGTISVSSDANLGDVAGALTFNGGILQVTGTSFNNTSRTINWGAAGGGFDIADASNTFEVSTDLTGTGGLTKLGAGTLLLDGTNNTYSGATTISAGTLKVGSMATMSQTSAVTVATGATLDLNETTQAIASLSGGGTVTNSAGDPSRLITGLDNTSTTFSGVIKDGSTGGAGQMALSFIGASTFTLTGTNTYTGGTSICFCSTLQLGNGGTTGSIVGDVTNGGTLVFNRSNAYTFAGAISDDFTDRGRLVQAGIGTTTLTGLNTYSGGTFVNAGTLQIAGTGTLGDTGAATTVAGGTLDLGGSTQTQNGGVTLTSGAIINGTLMSSALFDLQAGTVSAVLGGSGGVTKSGTGRVNITGIVTYTGATTVNAGTLSVNGDITSSSGVTVNAGGTLGGNGTVGDTTINGGALAPGNSIGQLTVVGNLVLTSAASYMVEVSPTNADSVNVTGSATLGGATVNASFAAGSYVNKQYTIITAAGGVTGTFGTQVNTSLPSNFTSTLTYDGHHAYLNLALNYVPPTPSPSYSPLNINQQNVANTLVSYFNRTGGIPLAFGALTPTGLTQVSGETGTGMQQATFDAMNLFLGLLTDPTVAGRGDAFGAPVATGYADESDALAYATGHPRKGAEREAYGMITKAAPRAAAFEARWNVWAAGFGGSRTTDGHAALGSNTATSREAGFAVGADYLLSPQTIAGFALSGGGTSFAVAGAGSGHSDLFQAGAYLRHAQGSAYVTAALAYGWQDVTTDRTMTISGIDRLRAQFDTNAFSGRVEGGTRYRLPYAGGIGITPYAALQVTALDLPAYAESVAGGANTFALSYASKTVTDTRTELGLRSDKSYAVDTAILTLRGRAAWAHDYSPNRIMAATFQTLPGTGFVVNGAAQAADSALTTVAAEMKWSNGISLAATFEGEFSQVTRSYAGKGVARYAW